MTEEKLIEIIRAELDRQWEDENGELDYHDYGGDYDDVEGAINIVELARAIISGIAP